jgi:hypothetical protein
VCIKHFLGSEAWNVIVKDRSAENLVSFSVPKSCPATSKLACQHSAPLQLEDISDSVEIRGVSKIPSVDQSLEQTPNNQNIASKVSVSTTALRNKRKMTKAPIVVTEVRRSE